MTSSTDCIKEDGLGLQAQSGYNSNQLKTNPQLVQVFSPFSIVRKKLFVL
jgi:hypothetical protein